MEGVLSRSCAGFSVVECGNQSREIWYSLIFIILPESTDTDNNPKLLPFVSLAEAVSEAKLTVLSLQCYVMKLLARQN